MSAEMLCYPVRWFCESLTDTSSGETVVASHPFVAPLLLNHLLCPHPGVTSCITVRGSAAWRQFFCLSFFLWLKCSISCSSPNKSWLFACACVCVVWWQRKCLMLWWFSSSSAEADSCWRPRGLMGTAVFSSVCVLTCSVPAAPSSPSPQTLAVRKDTASVKFRGQSELLLE